MLRSRSRSLCSSAAKHITYQSTRGGQTGLKFGDAVLQGLAHDKGLLVPNKIPTFDLKTLNSWRGLKFHELAYQIMKMYIPENEVPAENLKDILKRSYQTFRHEDVTPLTPLDGKDGRMWCLELYHGPTFAFKDVALQFLGNLFEFLLQERGGKITVVGATSGDTGSSAIYGLRGKAGVECFMMYPEGRTSMTQELQMITVMDENIHNIALGGTFDDCQSVVKTLFNDPPFRNKVNIAAVNSINWARILAQTVYYVYAYLKIMPVNATEKISFSVPTGNFGDILAGYYAKKMGLPVESLLVATNENDILHRFFQSGDYSTNGVRETLSPSMDIQVSSNFERFLYHMGGNDASACKELMDRFESKGALEPSKALVDACCTEMASERVTDAETLAEINDVYQTRDKYTLDPHSAIAVAAGRKHLSKIKGPMVNLCCAHWAKFSPVVEKAIGKEELSKLVADEFPYELSKLTSLPKRNAPLPNNVDAVKIFIEETLKSRQS